MSVFVDYTEKLAVGPWTGPNGSKFLGVVAGLSADYLSEASAQALAATWVYAFKTRGEDLEQPTDALEALGRAAGLLHYRGESVYGSLRPRLRAKWDFWTQGPKQCLVAELEAAGMPNAVVYVPASNLAPVDSFSPDYWSRFWLELPVGSHPVISERGFVVDDGNEGVVGVNRIGPTGLNTPEGALFYSQLRSILARMKPAQWVCWNIRFLIAGGGRVDLQVHKRFADPDYDYFTP